MKTTLAGTVCLLLAVAATAAPAERLQVYAASSLTDAFTEIARDFEKAHPGVKIELSFGGSQALRLQIQNGAPADLFATADSAQTDSLAGRGLALAATPFAHNSIVLVTPADAARVKGIPDLALHGLRIVLAEPGVPAGRYADEALSRMGRTRGAEFEKRVRANVASRETNVRAVLAKIVLGEADAGIVYRSDAASASGKVGTIEIAEAADIVAEYRIAVTVRAEASEAARSFRDAVLAEAGREALRRHGFER